MTFDGRTQIESRLRTQVPFRASRFAIDVPSSCRYDHPWILAGQGTMGLEIRDQVKNVDAVVIPVGGGGLIAGTALALKTLSPTVQIIVGAPVFPTRESRTHPPTLL